MLVFCFFLKAVAGCFSDKKNRPVARQVMFGKERKGTKSEQGEKKLAP